jgi:hypothetical protein
MPTRAGSHKRWVGRRDDANSGVRRKFASQKVGQCGQNPSARPESATIVKGMPAVARCEPLYLRVRT